MHCAANVSLGTENINPCGPAVLPADLRRAFRVRRIARARHLCAVIQGCSLMRLTGAGSQMRIAVGIPTGGRPDILSCAIACVTRQTRAPDRLAVCSFRASELASLAQPMVDAISPTSSGGLTHQRNTILDRCKGFDVVVFFDDDFLPHARYLEEIERAFAANPDVVMITGRVVADGIIGPGLSLDSARRILDRPDIGRAGTGAEPTPETLVDVH